jgi:hypothetical protein
LVIGVSTALIGSYPSVGTVRFATSHAGIRSDEVFATAVEMEIQQKPAAWLMALGVAGFLIGRLTVLYLIWRGLRYLGM